MSDLNKRKIFWHSRRGMLELDLLLVPFAQEVFESLPYQEQVLYQELLANEDQDLCSWFLERGEPEDARLKPLISKILAHHATRD